MLGGLDNHSKNLDVSLMIFLMECVESFLKFSFECCEVYYTILYQYYLSKSRIMQKSKNRNTFLNLDLKEQYNTSTYLLKNN